MGTTIDIAALDGSGSFATYIAEPEGTPKAAIIVIQEIFGVNPGIRAKADKWAKEGYLALAPDMFWRFAPGLSLDPDVPEEMNQAFDIRTNFDADKGVQDIEAVIRVARKRVGGGKVGIVGYCMGGRMAYLSATRTDVDASVGYYGARIAEAIREAHAIANPLMLHFAGQDGFIPPEQLAIIHAALDDNAHVIIHEYPGVDHGFATETGKRRNDAAAELADSRTRAFFAEHLA
ncbi:carboxymethylenebutenolidase [Sphingomonas oleivorans]|uniref:Carboxymethylenebutenolidase n=1 Tax=Sphingomonas oleivorans TaxID=1735121 RepID=A0A2T5G2P2_9SPHN|nr:dienelactone hydrolase family protein [Sphingomonas oleivorans]PTQ13418.1 carboxymethylenebutenolidase [Sphingomonas oleivorans]